MEYLYSIYKFDSNNKILTNKIDKIISLYHGRSLNLYLNKLKYVKFCHL